MRKKKAEKITVREYNEVLMNDALSLLQKAVGEIRSAGESVDKAIDNLNGTAKNIAIAYTQMRLDV